MALATVRDLIGSSLLLAGAVNKGASPDDDEYSDALDVFNSMTSSWALEQLFLPYVASGQFLTVAGQQNYSIGPAPADWVGVRPIKIRDAWYELAGLTLPLDELSFEQYGDIPVKSVASTIGNAFMYNGSYPNAFIAIWPVPSSVYKVILSYDAVFGDVTLDTDITTLPPGYVHAFRYGLAALIPAEYGKDVPKKIDQEATRSKGVLKSSNLKSLDAVVDANLPRGDHRAWNWLIG